jgi:hypothetical protein
MHSCFAPATHFERRSHCVGQPVNTGLEWPAVRLRKAPWLSSWRASCSPRSRSMRATRTRSATRQAAGAAAVRARPGQRGSGPLCRRVESGYPAAPPGPGSSIMHGFQRGCDAGLRAPLFRLRSLISDPVLFLLTRAGLRCRAGRLPGAGPRLQGRLRDLLQDGHGDGLRRDHHQGQGAQPHSAAPK